METFFDFKVSKCYDYVKLTIPNKKSLSPHAFKALCLICYLCKK